MKFCYYFVYVLIVYLQVMKDNCNPIFDETFEYVISLGDINSRQLEVTVVTKKTWFSSQSPVMGQVSETDVFWYTNGVNLNILIGVLSSCRLF